MTDSFRHRPAVRLFLLMLPIVCTLAVGAFSARMQSDALRLWYPTLEKSSLTPPNAVFPLVWTLLYILTGLSMGLVLLADDRHRKPMERCDSSHDRSVVTESPVTV